MFQGVNNISQDTCVRIALLEKAATQSQNRHDDIVQRINGVEYKQSEILALLLKIKFAAYGGAGILVADNIGIIGVIKKMVY
jgi:hypothetical protein